MIVIEPLTTYTPAVATRVRELLIALSRSGKDKGPIPEEWFQDVIASPSHTLLLAYDCPDDDPRPTADTPIVGMASLSVVMGAGIGKNLYLEDFVSDPTLRGKGIGSLLWDAMLEWGRTQGCKRLEFTCGNGREAAQHFYKSHGASIYDTNFFRIDL